jgi:hypothetical protein
MASCRRSPVRGIVLLWLLALPLAAQTPTREDVPVEKKNYSPYLEQHFPDRVFWGDTHLHTSYSTDAGMVGARVGPYEAYRLAMGGEVTSNTGQRVRLARPLDFLVIADHSENLGLAPMIATSDPILLKTEVGKLWHDMVKAGKGFEAFADWIRRGSTDGRDPINSPEMARSAWEYIVKAAEANNKPDSSRPSSAMNGRPRPAATTSTATWCSATEPTWPCGSSRSPAMTASIPRSSGPGCRALKTRPAAGCSRFRTTGT